MEKILFVNACARKESRTKKLADAVVSRWQGDIETLNLYEIDLAPLREDELNIRHKAQESGDFSHDIFKYTKQILDADVVVIAAPYWDLSFPSILKVYFENICVSGLLFDMNEGNTVTYSNIKKIVYVSTAGGPTSDYSYAIDYVKAFAKTFLGTEKVDAFTVRGTDAFPEHVVNQLMAEEFEKISKYDFNNN